MNYQRAKDIIASPNTIEVFYQGTPVWIDDVQPNGVTANVSYNMEPSRQTVPVPLYELEEGDVRQ